MNLIDLQPAPQTCWRQLIGLVARLMSPGNNDNRHFLQIPLLDYGRAAQYGVLPVCIGIIKTP